MTIRDKTIVDLVELSSRMEDKDHWFNDPLDQQMFLDAVGYAIKCLEGDDPFKDDEDFYDVKCNGECDTTYEIQREFESAISDAIGYLEDAEGKTDEDREKIKDAIRELNSVL